MTSDARNSAKTMKTLAVGLAAGAPALLVPEVALAATSTNVIVVATVSGITGTALGALVSGGIGYALYRHERRDLEQTIMRLAQPNQAPAPVATAAPKAESQPKPQVRPQPKPQARPLPKPAARTRAKAAVEQPKPESAHPHLELIDALPAEPLRIVEPLKKAPAAEASRPRVDLSGLPDPLATPAPAPQARVQPKDAEVAPGHGFVTSSAAPAASTAYVPSASNPYLAAEASAKAEAQAHPKSQQPFDYGDFAVDYVAKKSFKERMTTTARGVAAVLGERMGRNMMDDLPVIERADGSVGDVGTSWWVRDERVQQRPQAPSMTAPDLAGVSSMASYASHLEVPSDSARTLSGAERSSLIVSRVAPVEEEAYPEIGFQWHRQEDTWESALAALDDRVEDNLMAGREERARRRAARRATVAAEPQRLTVAEPPARPLGFEDAVGAIDTIDEPDGLERDTQFLNFRAPGNHPEVQDTGSYIDYLIQDEFKRNPSHQARQQARSYLRVHEGGQNTRAQEAI